MDTGHHMTMSTAKHTQGFHRPNLTWDRARQVIVSQIQVTWEWVWKKN